MQYFYVKFFCFIYGDFYKQMIDYKFCVTLQHQANGEGVKKKSHHSHEQ
jgi:hypothetical protein